jgi:hypothetical protein
MAILRIANALLASAVERRRSFQFAARDRGRRALDPATLYGEDLLTGFVGTGAACATGAGFAWLLLGVINPQSFGWSVALRVRPRPDRRGAAVLGASCSRASFRAGSPPR